MLSIFPTENLYKRPLDTFVPEIDYPSWFSQYLQINPSFCIWDTQTRNKYVNACPDNNQSCCTLFHINAAAINLWSLQQGPLYDTHGTHYSGKAFDLSTSNGQELLNLYQINQYINYRLG